MRRLGFAAVALLFLVGSASAQPVEQVVRDFGFTGRWAYLCDRAVSLDNWQRRIEISTTRIAWTDDCGGCQYAQIKYVILSATQPAANRMALRVRREDGPKGTYDFEIIKTDGKIRTVLNQPLDGDTLVRDGVILRSKQETPWFAKCP